MVWELTVRLARFAVGTIVAVVGFAVGGAAAFMVMERQMIVEWADTDGSEDFPVLVIRDGKYSVGTLRGVDDSFHVTAVGTGDLRKINDDLASSVGQVTDGSPYFRIESEKGGRQVVFIMEPTLQDRVNKGWYALDSGRITPLRSVSYGPGQGIAAAPFGILGGVVFIMAYRRGLRWFDRRRGVRRS